MRREPIAIWLGLLGCTASEPTAVSPREPESEPTARGAALPEPTLAPTTSSPPQVWCEATIDTRPRPLVRTRSFLLAMQELRRANLPRAAAVPLDELGARTSICGSPTCTPSLPRAIEVYAANEFGIGTILDVGEGELLVIPDVSPYSTDARCLNDTLLSIEPLGALVHAWSDVSPEPTYVHHGEYGGFGYYCNAPRVRHDVFVDPRSDTLLVDVVHGDPPLQVIPELRDDVLLLTLTGCDTTLELRVPRPAAKTGR
jgi:hypothetical protein